MPDNTEHNEFSSTLVIGLGGAGCRMLSTVEEMAERQGVTDNVELVAIDSKTGDIEANVPYLDWNQKIVFDEPKDKSLVEEIRRREYLPEGATLPDEGGATKIRGVGRYYLDDKANFKKTRSRLKAAYKRAQAQSDSDYVNIWLLHALGGGTGSGTYPLISALIRFAADEAAATDQSVTDKYRLRAVGTLPRLKGGKVIQDLDYRHHVNSYVAMRELRTLLGRNDHLKAEQKLKLYEAPQDMKKDFLRINYGDPLFDEYFLMGFDESRSSESYRRRMNEIAADLLLYYALVEGPEDFPETELPTGKSGTLYSLDRGVVSIPLKELSDYVIKKIDIEHIDRQLETAGKQVEDFDVALEYLDSVLKLDAGEIPERPPENERDRRVTPNLVEESQEKAREISRFSGEDHLEKQANTKITEVVDGTQPGTALQGTFQIQHVDKETIDEANPRDESPPLSDRLDEFSVPDVVRFLFYDQLLTEQKREEDQERTKFENTTEELWNKYEDEFEEEYPEQFAKYQHTGYKKRFEGLAAFFSERIPELEEANESIFKLLDDEIAEREEDRDRLISQYNAYESSQEDVETVRGFRGDARERLSRAREDFEDAIEVLNELTVDLKNDRSRLVNKKERKQRELNQSSEDSHTTFPLIELESLSPEDYAEWIGYELDDNREWWHDDVKVELKETAKSATGPAIVDLVADGYISEEDMDAVFITAMSMMGEPVENRKERNVDDELLNKNESTDTHPLLALLLNEKNKKWKEEIDSIGELVADFDRFADLSVSIREEHSIRLLGIYSNLHFSKMSEYGKVHEYLHDDDRRISEVFFGEGNPESEIDEHLAFPYPELVDLSSDEKATATPDADLKER